MPIVAATCDMDASNDVPTCTAFAASPASAPPAAAIEDAAARQADFAIPASLLSPSDIPFVLIFVSKFK